MSAISSTAARKEPSLAFDGLLKPLIFLTNWSDAARISSSVTGGSKLKRVLIFLHIRYEFKDIRRFKRHGASYAARRLAGSGNTKGAAVPTSRGNDYILTLKR
jgi:hypothetical protein